MPLLAKHPRPLVLVLSLCMGCGPVTSDFSGDPDAQAVDDGTIAQLCDLECAQYEICDGSGSQPTCRCAEGFSGTPCEWEGVVGNPQFQRVEDWTATLGVDIQEEEGGFTSPGQVIFPYQSLCQRGHLFQEVTMPDFGDVGPMVAQVRFRGADPGDYVYQNTPIGISTDRVWTHVANVMAQGWQTQRVCLGDAASGKQFRFGIGPMGPVQCADDNHQVVLDSVDVLPAQTGECPQIGEVLNGDMEANGGWTFVPEPPSTATLVEGVGINGTRALRIQINETCKKVSFAGKFSVPSASKNFQPALEFQWAAPSHQTVELRLNDRRLTKLFNTDVFSEQQFHSEIVCLPPWTHGRINTLSGVFGFQRGGQACGVDQSSNPPTFLLDAVKVVSVPACGTDKNMLDGGFEYAPRLSPERWVSPQEYSVATISDATQARTGKGVLELWAGIRCRGPHYVVQPFVPPADTTGGPAFEFWSRVPPHDFDFVIPRFSYGATTIDLVQDGEWHRNMVCLDPKLVNSTTILSFGMDPGIGQCNSFGGRVYAYVDDMRLITDSRCPKQ